MLSAEQNEVITRCGPGTLMGNLLRQYWIPAVQSAELPEPDCAPLRVRILDEDLIAFRTTSGKVGLIDDVCPHRGASMFFGRNEEEGLRCVYHGWKFDITGQCTDMMNEPVESTFKNKVRTTAYPCTERGGIVWAYMGSREVPPPLPDLEANMVVETRGQVRTTLNTTLNNYNWLQAMENNMDTGHNPILHRGAVTPEAVDNVPYAGGDLKIMVGDRTPRFIIRETEFGASMSCYRAPDSENYHHRTMHWLFPFYTMSPVPKLGSATQFTATVPVDDYHNMQWNMTRMIDPEYIKARADYAEFLSGAAPNAGRNQPLPNTSGWLGRFRNYLSLEVENDFGIDRELQRTKPPTLQGWTGLKDTNTQDEAMKWSQGRRNGGIVDRHREHLGTSDAMIIRVRRLLLDAARQLNDFGTPPPALDTPDVYRVRAGWIVTPKDVDYWEVTRDLREAFKKEAVVVATTL
jgi:phthalate 4,5-dioxygenase oxygenase subunit